MYPDWNNNNLDNIVNYFFMRVNILLSMSHKITWTLITVSHSNIISSQQVIKYILLFVLHEENMQWTSGISQLFSLEALIFTCENEIWGV